MSERGYRDLRAWIESGGVLRDWPMLDVNCGRCHLAAERCRTEAETILARLEAEGRDATAEEQESLDIFTRGCEVFRQADAVMYPNPYELLNGADERTGMPLNQGGRTFRYDEEDQKQRARPTAICPRCSTPAAEQQLRHECIDAGYGILPTGVFVTQPFNQDAPEKPDFRPDQQLPLEAAS